MERLLSNTLGTSNQNQNYKSLSAIQAGSSSSQLVDIFISNVWPASIAEMSAVHLPSPELASIGVSTLDDTVRRLKPRYHFAASGGEPPMFWEREPFVWSDEEGRVSRFVSLGAFGGSPATGKKQRVRCYCGFYVASCNVLSSGFTRSPYLPIRQQQHQWLVPQMRAKILSQRRLTVLQNAPLMNQTVRTSFLGTSKNR